MTASTACSSQHPCVAICQRNHCGCYEQQNDCQASVVVHLPAIKICWCQSHCVCPNPSCQVQDLQGRASEIFFRHLSRLTFWRITLNKANLGDLIAASRLTDRNWIKIVKVFSPCDLKNYRAPLLYYVKLCASFQLLSGNAQFRSKSSIFYPVWPWNLMDDLEKQCSRLPLISFLHR